MSSSTERVRRKREIARIQGLCVTCCKVAPPRGLLVCTACKTSSNARRRERIRSEKQAFARQQTLEEFERAGDAARANHLYEQAAEHYQRAVNLQDLMLEERARISEKLGYCIAVGKEPQAAAYFFKIALDAVQNDRSQASKTINILLQCARLNWLNSRTEVALPLLQQAIDIADATEDASLRVLSHSKMADYLLGFGRVSEAEILLDIVDHLCGGSDYLARTNYYEQRSKILFRAGSVKQAVMYLEHALAAAEKDGDPWHVASMWNSIANLALRTGDTLRAKACLQRELLVARRCGISLYIPRACLAYAELLYLTGEYASARDYIMEAISAKAHVPLIDQSIAVTGLPLALRLNDRELIQSCARFSAIDAGLRSGQVRRFLQVATVFSAWYAHHNRMQEAERLLHHALEKSESQRPTCERDFDFPLAVARYGSPDDFSRVRALFQPCASIPYEATGKPYLLLFDAFAADRHNQSAEARRLATQAAHEFAALGWHGYSDIARTLLPKGLHISLPSPKLIEPGEIFDALTLREREVAELALKGFTNRFIAARLEISENTVESHMASIMARLGIRSRHQLAGMLTEASA